MTTSPLFPSLLRTCSLVVLAACGPSPTESSSVVVALSEPVFVPCAPGNPGPSVVAAVVFDITAVSQQSESCVCTNQSPGWFGSSYCGDDDADEMTCSDPESDPLDFDSVDIEPNRGDCVVDFDRDSRTLPLRIKVSCSDPGDVEITVAVHTGDGEADGVTTAVVPAPCEGSSTG